jgi:enamine deaminase RidA (YjgF/YER057c/UK114 family)
VGWDENQELVAAGFAEQFARALGNVVTVVREAGGRPEHLVRLTIYVTDCRDYLAALEEIGDAYRGIMGRHYPAMALLEVQALLEPGARVEIEGTAALPP